MNTKTADLSIETRLRKAGYRVEPRRSKHIGTHGQRAIVRIRDSKWMGDFYALDAFAQFVGAAS